MMEPFPERPKGMHKDTYMRMFCQLVLAVPVRLPGILCVGVGWRL
jgi:hypothetical protein